MLASVRSAFRKWSFDNSTISRAPLHRSSFSACQRAGMSAGEVSGSASSRPPTTTTSSNGTARVQDDRDDEYADLADACRNVHGRVYAFLERKPSSERIQQAQRITRESLGVIGEALQRYSLDQLSFSYNGGKDCLVLLILYLAALHTHSTHTSQPLPRTLPSVYIVTPNPFPSVTSFVHSSAKKYHLSLSQYHKPMREAFASYLEDSPLVQAIFVGTRRTDPHGAKLTSFDPTDGGWPAFVRIHPVIDWHYADVWGFIKEVGVEYCELYDMGYTSLGGTDDTHPNPALAVTADGAGDAVRYRPAYELVEDDAERLGRDGRS